MTRKYSRNLGAYAFTENNGYYMFYIHDTHIRPSLQSIDLFRTINHDLYIDDSGPRKIDCGLKEIDADKYKRNYEVKGKAVNNLNDSLAFKWNTSEVTLVKGAWSLLFNPLSRGQSFTYPPRPPLPQAQTQILMLRIFLTTSGSLTAE